MICHSECSAAKNLKYIIDPISLRRFLLRGMTERLKTATVYWLLHTLLKLLHNIYKHLHAFYRHCVVNRGTVTANRPVAR
jgi:hypothetical protein